MNSIGDNYPSYYYVGLLGTVLFVFILSLKYCCGSISIRNILKDMKVNKEKQDKYKNLFTTRESLMFHISWAKSRGDMGDARKLLIQLDELDKVGVINLLHFLLVYGIYFLPYSGTIGN